MSDYSIGLIGILLLGILTMWYILYLKIVKVVGRRRRRREVVMEPSLSLSHLIHNCHAIVHQTQPVLTVEQLRYELIKNKQQK